MCCTNWWLDEKLFRHCWHWCGFISPLAPIMAGNPLILFGLIAAARPPGLVLFPLFVPAPTPRCRSRACCICIALLCMKICVLKQGWQGREGEREGERKTDRKPIRMITSWVQTKEKKKTILSGGCRRRRFLILHSLQWIEYFCQKLHEMLLNRNWYYLFFS